MKLNWDDLRIFLSVARAGSLSAAARSLKVSQPTVGRRLKALEEVVGARLFDRLPEGFAPTAAGAELLPMAEEMERAAEALGRRQAARRAGQLLSALHVKVGPARQGHCRFAVAGRLQRRDLLQTLCNVQEIAG